MLSKAQSEKTVMVQKFYLKYQSFAQASKKARKTWLLAFTDTVYFRDFALTLIPAKVKHIKSAGAP
jgi:hypothetical protein